MSSGHRLGFVLLAFLSRLQLEMADTKEGTYPFVTSSNTGIAGAFNGLGLSPHMKWEIIGVVKAYTTRVGSGPFPTENTDALGQKLQKDGREFGVTTGRPRRCGPLDLPLLRYSTSINHYTVCLRVSAAWPSRDSDIHAHSS